MRVCWQDRAFSDSQFSETKMAFKQSGQSGTCKCPETQEALPAPFSGPQGWGARPSRQAGFAQRQPPSTCSLTRSPTPGRVPTLGGTGWLEGTWWGLLDFSSAVESPLQMESHPDRRGALWVTQGWGPVSPLAQCSTSSMGYCHGAPGYTQTQIGTQIH